MYFFFRSIVHFFFILCMFICVVHVFLSLSSSFNLYLFDHSSLSHIYSLIRPTEMMNMAYIGCHFTIDLRIFCLKSAILYISISFCYIYFSDIFFSFYSKLGGSRHFNLDHKNFTSDASFFVCLSL